MKFRALMILMLLCTPVLAEDVLIRNATIMTVSDGTITNGSLLIRDGKIASVGRDITAGPDVRVIDATGKWVTPGLIDCHSHIAADSINEGAVNVSSMTGIEDVLDATDINIYRDMAGGVTTANILHGSANPIGGRNAVIKLRWGQSESGLLFEGAKPGIKFALGENTKRPGIRLFAGNNPLRYPATRMGVEDVIRSAFQEARDYMAAWKSYEQKKAAGERALPPAKDYRLEPLAEILRGERLLHSHSYRADEILMLIRVADDFGFKIATFQHVLEGFKVAKELAAHGAGASTFSDWWAYKVEAYDAIPHNAAIMTRKGVVVSINSDSAEEARHLNQEAAKAMRYGGLNEDEALALVTLNPARQLQIDDRVGSLEAGKDADVVIYGQYPLSVYAVPEMVFVDGELMYSPEIEKARLEGLEAERKALLELDKEPKKKETSDEKVDVSGGWEVNLSLPEGTFQISFSFTQSGDTITGQVNSPVHGTFDIFDGRVEGNRISFKITIDEGEGPIEIAISAVVDGDSISGSATSPDGESSPFEGSRTVGPASWTNGGGVR